MEIGSLAIGRLIAHGIFIVLLIRAWLELRPRTAILFALIWMAGYVGLPYILYGELYFTPLVAVLDVILLFMLGMQESGGGLRLR
jgi:hypothetical protein